MANRHLRFHLRASVLTIAAIFLLFGEVTRVKAQDILVQARALDRAGQRAEALLALNRYLEKTPNDTDARGLYGIMLSWQGRYVEARAELGRVLAVNPVNSTAVLALINVELWSGNPETAEQIASRALQVRPGDTALLLARARALQKLNRPGETRGAVDRVLQTDPRNGPAREMQQSLSEGSRVWEASFEHSSEWLSDGQDPWQESQFSLKRGTSVGPAYVRYSRGDRFALSDSQVTVEFYPTIRPGTWATIALGYSNDHTLYPHYLFAGDLNQAVGHGFEVSMGYRRLSFAQPVNIYTPTLNKYYRNWLFTSRLLLTPNSTGTSKSVQLITRRYFRDGASYIGLRAGRGSSPTETRSVSDTEILYASSFVGELYKILGHRWAVNVRSGVSKEDRAQRSNLEHYIADVSLYFRF